MVVVKVDIPDEISNYFSYSEDSMSYNDFINRILLLEQDIKTNNQQQVVVSTTQSGPTSLSEDIGTLIDSTTDNLEISPISKLLFIFSALALAGFLYADDGLGIAFIYMGLPIFLLLLLSGAINTTKDTLKKNSKK